MSLFLGIGLGPIQTGIFLSGAALGGIERLVIAEVDAVLVEKVRASGGRLAINIAHEDAVTTEVFEGVEIYNPLEPGDLRKLVEAASEATEVATALPSVKFFAHIAGWLRDGFRSNPDAPRLVYAAENHTPAAELLRDAVGGDFPRTHYLNTVVGKMSGVVPAAECVSRGLASLVPGADRGHLVEEFNRILISSCPGVEERRVRGLHVKEDLLPFEEAKLYGHNAIHLLMGLLASEKGMRFMAEARDDEAIMAAARTAFVEESGKALCAKWAGVDRLFTAEGYGEYAADLLRRMTNTFLKDAIDRVCRDLERKMGWDDRLVGTMRVVLSQGVRPETVAVGARIAARRLWGESPDAVRNGCAALWPAPWSEEHERILALIEGISK